MSRLLRRMSRYEHLVPLLLRIPVALVFLFATWPKVTNLAGSAVLFTKFGLPGWTGPVIAILELVGGIAILLGVGTRLFGLLFIGIMIVAIATVNGPQAMAKGTFDFNAVRLQILTAFACLALVITGSGALSLEQALWGRKQGESPE